MKNLLGKNYKIRERKSSQFGRVGYVDRQSGLEYVWKGKPIAYYEDLTRKDAYRTCQDRYFHDQLARPIINMIVHATFSKPPDFQGDEELVRRAQKVVRDSNIDWTVWGRDAEVFGDLFIRAFLGKNAKLASIPPESIDIDYDQKNVLDIMGYTQFKDEAKPVRISADEMVHMPLNSTSNKVYGCPTLRPALWWLDVLDNLWERNAIRAVQYYGAPLIWVSGIPGEHQGDVQSSLQDDGQRPGRTWVFPPEVTVDTLDFTKGYDITTLINTVYQYVLASCGIPQHLVYESDSSRGVAMFSADGFEMMIKARRQSWTLAIIKAMRIIFQSENLWSDDSEFSINWAPVFLRDMKNFAAVLDVARTHKIASLQTSREMLGLDHSKEEERIEDEPEEPAPIQKPVAPPAKPKNSK
jgi:hypothetical protein